jgi:hypothetical protein
VRKDKLEDYELFYVAIPQQSQSEAPDDGLSDTPITDLHDVDLHETLDSEKPRGLSHDQASRLADDLAKDAMEPPKPHQSLPAEAPARDQDNLFGS